MQSKSKKTAAVSFSRTAEQKRRAAYVIEAGVIPIGGVNIDFCITRARRGPDDDSATYPLLSVEGSTRAAKAVSYRLAAELELICSERRLADAVDIDRQDISLDGDGSEARDVELLVAALKRVGAR